jgi:3'-phosphoadenosine 5'-phosphosulfate sulfotransferase (PAPS reductase)/FAD synthetase
MLSRWGWPHKSGGWCVARKTQTCNKAIRALKGTVECIGYTINEKHRAEKPSLLEKKWQVRFPLIEEGWTSTDALDFCKDLEYDWGGLYEHFSRVSCFCCPKAEKTRVSTLEKHFPELYKQYMNMDAIAKLCV